MDGPIREAGRINLVSSPARRDATGVTSFKVRVLQNTRRATDGTVREVVLATNFTNEGEATAHYIGERESRGCTFANHWRNYPFLRMPNVHVEPGPPGSPTPEEIIADTKDGILIDGRGSYSIDQQRYNGQFGGDAFWEIRDGKKTRMLKNVTYHAMTTEFWGACDAVCGPEAWRLWGTPNCGKGEPMQTGHVGHGCSGARFRDVQEGGMS